MSPAAGRIRDRSTFRALRRPAGVASRGPIRASYLPPASAEEQEWARVGYMIGRRCGNAVYRNRLRRRCRAAVQEASAALPPGTYLLRPDPEAVELTYPDLARAVSEAMAAAADRAATR
jgi:ribonuclease P protein component